MLRGSISGFPWIAKFLVLAGLFYFFGALFDIFSTGIIRIFFPDLDLIAILKKLSSITSPDELSPREIYAVDILQIFSSIGTFVITSFMYLYLCGEDFFVSTGLDKKISISNILFITLIMLASTGIINPVNQWNENTSFPASLQSFEERLRNMQQIAETMEKAFLSNTSPLGLIMNIFMIAVVAGVCEEIFFRGILQNLFAKWTRNTHAAVWITAFIFSFIHLEFFGFFPRVLLGALLGYLYLWSGSLRASIFGHIINNGAAVLVYYFINRGMLAEQSAESVSWEVTLASIPVCAFLLFIYRRNNRMKTIDA